MSAWNTEFHPQNTNIIENFTIGLSHRPNNDPTMRTLTLCATTAHMGNPAGMLTGTMRSRTYIGLPKLKLPPAVTNRKNDIES